MTRYPSAEIWTPAQLLAERGEGAASDSRSRCSDPCQRGCVLAVPDSWHRAVLSGVGLGLLLLGLCFATVAAASGSLTYIKGGNVFVSPAEGGAAAQVTRDGSPSDPYVAASQSDSG